MKKLIALLLVFVFALAFVGCSKEDDAASEKKPITDVQKDKLDYFVKVEKDLQLNPAVYTGSAVYASDKRGLWRSVDGKVDILTKNIAEDITTDGKTILYRCGEGRAEENSGEEINFNYEIRKINCDGSDDKMLTLCSQDARPLTMYNGKVVYIDYMDEDSNDYSIFSVDSKTSETEILVNCVLSDVKISGTKIYYFPASSEDYGAFYYYDLADNSTTLVSYTFESDQVFCDGGKIYTVQLPDAQTDYNKYELCSVENENYEVVAEIEVENSLEIQLIYNGIVYYRNDKGLYGQYDNYMMSLSDKKPVKHEDFLYDCSLIPSGDVVIYSTEDYYFYCDGKTLKTIDGIDPEKQIITCFDGKRFYCAHDGDISSVSANLKDEIPQSEEPTNPVQKTPSQKSDYVYTEKELQLPFYGALIITGEEAPEDSYMATNRLPQLKIDSSDAKAINKEIIEKFGEHFERYEGTVPEHSVGRVDYVAFQNGDVLSLAVEMRSVDTPSSMYGIYNINVKTGKRVSKEALVSMSDVSLEEAYDLIRDNIEEKFQNLNNINMEGQEEIIKSTKADSLADENVEAAEFYFNGDGKLVAIYRVYWIAGAGCYDEHTVLDAHIK